MIITFTLYIYIILRARGRACVCVCARACVRACVRMCVHAVCVQASARERLHCFPYILQHSVAGEPTDTSPDPVPACPPSTTDTDSNTKADTTPPSSDVKVICGFVGYL